MVRMVPEAGCVVNAQYIRVLAGTGDIGAYWVLIGTFELCIRT